MHLVFLPRQSGQRRPALGAAGTIAQNGRRPSDLGLSDPQKPRGLMSEVRSLRSALSSGWNDQFLADLDLVGIVQVVGFGDGQVFVGVAVEMFADLGQVVARLHGVILRTLVGLDVMFQVGKRWIDSLNRIPDAVFAGFRDRDGLQVKLVAIQIQVQKLSSFLLNLVQNRLIFLLELFKLVGHVFSSQRLVDEVEGAYSGAPWGCSGPLGRS